MLLRLTKLELDDCIFSRPINHNKLLPLRVIFDPNCYQTVIDIQKNISYLLGRSWPAEIYLTKALLAKLPDLGFSTISFHPIEDIDDSEAVIVLLNKKSIISSIVLQRLRILKQQRTVLISSGGAVLNFLSSLKKVTILNRDSLFQVIKNRKIAYLANLENINTKQRYLERIQEHYPKDIVGLSHNGMLCGILGDDFYYCHNSSEIDLENLLLNLGFLLQDKHLSEEKINKMIPLANLL